MSAIFGFGKLLWCRKWNKNLVSMLQTHLKQGGLLLGRKMKDSRKDNWKRQKLRIINEKIYFRAT